MKLVLIISSLAFVFQVANAQNFEKINDGYRAGRSDMPRAAYDNNLSNEAQPLQDEYAYLSKKVLGLQFLQLDSSFSLALLVTRLEIALLQLYIKTYDANINLSEKNILGLDIIRNYQNLRFTNERLFEDTIRFIDLAIPGPNGLQTSINLNSRRGYLPNYRTDEELTSEKRKSLLLERKEQYLKKAGNFNEIKNFSVELANSWNQVAYVEYVELVNGKVKVTEGKAGHTLLADGNAVLAAGQIVVLKDKRGSPILLIISNASGNYKPDMLNTVVLARKIAKKLKLSEYQIISTKAEPLSTQIARLQQKGSFSQDSFDQQRLAGVSQDLKSFLNHKSTFVCKDLFFNK